MQQRGFQELKGKGAAPQGPEDGPVDLLQVRTTALCLGTSPLN